MVYGVAVGVARLLLKIDAKRCRQFFQLVKTAGHAQVAVPEMSNVLADQLRCVAFRVDADEDDLRQRLLPGGGKVALRRCERLQRQGANVRAMRKAEEHQAPLIEKCFTIHRVTQRIEQLEFRQRVRCGQHECGFHFRRRTQPGRNGQSGRERDRQHDGDKNIPGTHLLDVFRFD